MSSTIKTTPAKRSHINRACEACRLRKTKCNGRQPCKGCQSHAVQCIYRTGNARKKKKTVPQTTELPANLMTPPTPKGTDFPPSHVVSDLVQFKQHQALRVGIGVSNPATGSFQFYGKISDSYSNPNGVHG